MNVIDIGIILFVAVFILVFFGLGIVTALESFLSFIISFFLSSLLLSPILSFLYRIGWRENVQTPLAIYPLLLILFWGIIFAVLSVLYNPHKTTLSKILSLPVLLIYAIFLAFAISIFLPQYLEVFGLPDAANGSRFINFVNGKISVKNFRQRYLNSLDPNLIQSVIVTKEDNEVILLKFEISSAISRPDLVGEMFKLINESRKNAGLTQFLLDPKLDVLAQNYAQAIAQTKYFGHIDKDNKLPSDRARSAGINFDYIGENLVLAPDAMLAHQALMDSAPHKKNIESPVFKRVGIGAVDLGKQGIVFVEEFSN